MKKNTEEWQKRIKIFWPTRTTTTSANMVILQKAKFFGVLLKIGSCCYNVGFAKVYKEKKEAKSNYGFQTRIKQISSFKCAFSHRIS